MRLDTGPRLADPDAVFELLTEAHQGLDPEASRRLDAALVLLLANHIGEMAVLREAVSAARAAALAGAAPAPEAPRAR